MDRIVPRLQVFELCDQSWFPSFIRSRVQSCLTGFWTVRVPIVQQSIPAEQTARIMHDKFGEQIREYTVVDFCSGAGGPTPSIERALNQRLETRQSSRPDTGNDALNAVDFVLTDLSPHTTAWKAQAARSRHVHYVPSPVDATDAAKAKNLLAQAGLPERRVLRTFHLSFHHFSDNAAVSILRNTFKTADAIAIVELIDRSFSSLLLNVLLLLPLGLFSPILYWNDPVHLFFTYIVPIIPAVTIWDGLMSTLRERRPDELMALVEKAQVDNEIETWEWTWGREMHTFPFGYTNYFIGRKRT